MIISSKTIKGKLFLSFGVSVIITTSIFLALLTSCQNSNLQIALMLPNIETERFKKDSALFIVEANKIGCLATVTNAQNNEELQYKQAVELIKQKYKTLVIAAVNSNKIKDVVEKAHDAGVKIVIYDGMFNKCRADFRISFNDIDIGHKMAQYVLNSGQNGNCLILGGDHNHVNSIQINAGIYEVLKPQIANRKINIAFDSYLEGWSKTEACFYVLKYLKLTNDTPRIIIASNDDIAAGAIQAFECAGISTLPLITGQDASIEGCRYIIAGKQALTIYKPIFKLAATAAMVAVKLAKNEKITETNGSTPNDLGDIPTIYIDLIPVTKENIKQTVLADGFQKEADIL